MSASITWPSRPARIPALHGRITINPDDDGYVDEIAIERAMRGDAVSVTFRELVTAYQRLTDTGAGPAYASDLAAAS